MCLFFTAFKLEQPFLSIILKVLEPLTGVESRSNAIRIADVVVVVVEATTRIVDIPRITVVVAVDTTESASPHIAVGAEGLSRLSLPSRL